MESKALKTGHAHNLFISDVSVQQNKLASYK